MKRSKIIFFTGIFAVLLLLGFGIYYQQKVSLILPGFIIQPQPCQKPITYSIANIDPRFNLTEVELLAEINQAENLWESAANKQLFEYAPAGDLKISLVYDYRQKATDELKKIGIAINDDRSTYDALKAKYNSLVASYDKEKKRIEALVAAYNAAKSAYEKDVKNWNTSGRATKAEYDALEQERIALNNQAAMINQAEISFNASVDMINSAAAVLNGLVATLNLKVDTYNTVGSATGKQFTEGEYVSTATSTAINIFQYTNKNQLLGVLVHELGHALGLEHIDNPKAVMYYLNEGVNDKLTADDIAALKKICGIE